MLDDYLQLHPCPTFYIFLYIMFCPCYRFMYGFQCWGKLCRQDKEYPNHMYILESHSRDLYPFCAPTFYKYDKSSTTLGIHYYKLESCNMVPLPNREVSWYECYMHRYSIPNFSACVGNSRGAYSFQSVMYWDILNTWPCLCWVFSWALHNIIHIHNNTMGMTIFYGIFHH